MKLNLLLAFTALVNTATGVVVEVPVPNVITKRVELGAAGDYVILTKSGISSVADSDITGDIGVSAIAGTAITGFNLELDSGKQFSTSEQVDGKVRGK